MGFSLPDRLTFDQKSKPILPAEPPAFLFGPAERLEGAQLGVWSGPFSDPILHQNPSISDLFWTIFGPLLDHFRIRFSIRIHRFRIIFGPLLDHFRSRFSIRIHRFRIILDHFWTIFGSDCPSESIDFVFRICIGLFRISIVSSCQALRRDNDWLRRYAQALRRDNGRPASPEAPQAQRPATQVPG